jgi:hypothetical protein
MPKILFIILTTLLFSCNSEPDNNTLKHWTYKFDADFEKLNDSIKPIGQIEFWRTKSVNDKQRQEVYEERWFPSMEFEIYNISNLKYCEELSKRTKILSSCVETGVGGDLIIVKNYIFLNRSVCINCVGTDNGIDFCRPIANKILSELDLTKNSTLKEVDKEIGKKIKRPE